MVKFKRLNDKDVVNNPLHRWLTFFDKNTSIEILEEVVEMDSAIQKVQEKMEYISQDKEALRAYHMREMAIHDYASGIANAEERGKEKKAVEVAKGMLKDNLSVDMIVKYTNLDVDTITQLKKEINK